MACVAETAQNWSRRRGVAVIADWGEFAAVVLAPLPGEARIGDRFLHGGVEWIVVRTKDHLRGAVAVPVSPEARQ